MAVAFAAWSAVVMAGDVAVVLVPENYQYTVEQAKAVDGLLARLAKAYGAAYTVSAASPWAEQLDALATMKPDAMGTVVDGLRQELGAERVVVTRWAKGAVTVVDATGKLAEIEADAAKAEELAARLFDACMGRGGAGASKLAPAVAAPAGGFSGPKRQPGPGGPPPKGQANTAPLAGRAAAKVGGREAARANQGRLLYEMAVQSYRQGNYKLALDQLLEAVRAGASKTDVLQLQAQIYGALGDEDRQARALRDLLREEPGRTRAAVALALLLDQQGLWQQAINVLERAIEHNARDGQLYIRMAQIYQRQGRTLKALEILQRGYEATGDPAVAIELAAAQEGAGDWRGAMALYGKLAASEDRRVRVRALDALGDLYSRMGMLREAVEAYSEAAKAAGAEGALTVERYRRIYDAADRLIATHLDRAWQAFEDVATGTGALAREEALAAVQAALAEAERALALSEGALPPPELEREHRQRKLYYALVREALVAAATFIDTGRPDMAAIARKRYAEALQERPQRPGGEGE